MSRAQGGAGLRDGGAQTIFSQSTQESAREALHKAAELLQSKYPAAAAVVQEAEDDVLAYMSFPTQHWR